MMRCTKSDRCACRSLNFLAHLFKPTNPQSSARSTFQITKHTETYLHQHTVADMVRLHLAPPPCRFTDHLSPTQAPKTLPPLAKQNLILTYLQSSRTCHSIKDLEKALPAVASINGMQVKDYLQALNDEGKIRVEKIGSGNWYWSFLSEEKNTRDVTLAKLREEKAKVEATVAEFEQKVEEASEIRGEDEGRGELVAKQISLTEEVGILKRELETYKDADPGEVERRRKEIVGFKAKAERWTDNIGILEGRLLDMLSGDRERLEGIQRDVYDNEYVEGEGLKEL